MGEGACSGGASRSSPGITSITSPARTARDSTRTEDAFSQRRPSSMTARACRRDSPVSSAAALSRRSPSRCGETT